MLADRRAAGDREARAADLLEALGLQGRSSRRPGQLTGAEQQRQALAVAPANGPHAGYSAGVEIRSDLEAAVLAGGLLGGWLARRSAGGLDVRVQLRQLG